MIFDHIKNIGLYKGLTPAIDTALDYIAKVTPEVEIGTYFLDNGVKVVISEYTTRLVNEKGYEAHRRFADIQFCVAGTELVRCKPLAQVEESIPYNPDKDVARYTDCPGADLIVGEGYFLLVFPEDAHEPCLAVGGVQAPVKKVVVKIPVE
ncbi:MAG: YhcH/YjgK/YiaL family protein [Bacteroidales bacterium]|nr:YhcH/YjgK/YiaL family protein [Bacteroidales bacterium]